MILQGGFNQIFSNYFSLRVRHGPPNNVCSNMCRFAVLFVSPSFMCLLCLGLQFVVAREQPAWRDT